MRGKWLSVTNFREIDKKRKMMNIGLKNQLTNKIIMNEDILDDEKEEDQYPRIKKGRNTIIEELQSGKSTKRNNDSS